MDLLTFILVAIGGLNWGLIGLFQFNLVEKLFGTGMFATVIYVLVGLAALWMIIGKFSGKKR